MTESGISDDGAVKQGHFTGDWAVILKPTDYGDIRYLRI